MPPIRRLLPPLPLLPRYGRLLNYCPKLLPSSQFGNAMLGDYIVPIIGYAPGGPFTRQELEEQLDALYADFTADWEGKTYGDMSRISGHIIGIEAFLSPDPEDAPRRR